MTQVFVGATWNGEVLGCIGRRRFGWQSWYCGPVVVVVVVVVLFSWACSCSLVLCFPLCSLVVVLFFLVFYY